MAKRDRWVIRFAADIDGGLTTANKAYEEIEEIRTALEKVGYHVLDYRGMMSPMPAEQRKLAEE